MSFHHTLSNFNENIFRDGKVVSEANVKLIKENAKRGAGVKAGY